MECPRDGTALIEERMHGIEVDHCPACNGRWLDHHELDELEATRAEEDERRGTIRFAERDSHLRCPVCGDEMTAFNYRADDLEIDTCRDEHGFWPLTTADDEAGPELAGVGMALRLQSYGQVERLWLVPSGAAQIEDAADPDEPPDVEAIRS